MRRGGDPLVQRIIIGARHLSSMPEMEEKGQQDFAPFRFRPPYPTCPTSRSFISVSKAASVQSPRTPRAEQPTIGMTLR